VKKSTIRTGLDQLLEDVDGWIPRSARIAVLANPTSVTRRFEHIVDALARLDRCPVRLFGPEHGVRGEAQDMIAVDGGVDPISGTPTISLYGDTFASLAPPDGTLDDLDLMIVDLQDVGSRYYTYIYTALMTVEACTRAGVRTLVLDRPNPIGDAVEGPDIDPGFESFVGMLPLPNRHGLTLVEVLQFARARGHELAFDAIPVLGWRSNQTFAMYDAPWVLPSPNMPTFDTAYVYPGMCLLEGTNLSEGRGTTRPFELFGAPYVNAPDLYNLLTSLELPGVIFRMASFEPTFQKWARERCSGLQIHVVDHNAYQALRTGAAVVWACAKLHPDAFAWRADAYEFVDDIPAIDLLFGSARPRKAIEAGCSFDELSSLLETPRVVLDAITRARLESYRAGPA